jgi:polygalacturonase
MSSNVTKRTLSAGLGVGALALLAPRASADTPFSSFAFRATGAPTARTLPDRLGELKNVKDFGARGNGSTNDTAAIQAAVNRGGHIFFPGGIYNISSPILVSGSEANVRLTGESCILEWVGPNAGLLGCNADDDGENDRGLTATDTKT